NQLRRCMRAESDAYLMDRLLVGGIIEARGCERFSLLGEALEDPALKRVYRSIGQSEARHANMFVELAQHYFPASEVDARLRELIAAEARILAALPLRAALH